MSRFLRLCAFLSVLFFANNVMAAGYICPTDMKYTSCKSGYYLSECGTDKSNWTGQTVTGSYGNSCNKCPSGYNCNGGTKCPVSNSIACNPGYYLPAGATTCIKCGIAPDGTTKQGGYYCPGGSFDKTAGGGRNACPAIDGRVRTTHPEYFYANENMQITHITFPTWFDVNASITDCRVNYNVKNNRGTAHQEGVRYNSSTGKYDGAGGPIYYSKINAGYYGAVKHSSTYCNTASNPMYYQNALLCPAGKYCEGYANGMPLCSSGTYNDTLGITGDISAGTYSAGGAKVQAPKSGSDCIGGSCGKCLEDHYCPEGTGSPISCPSPYNNSEIGATSIGGCYISCLAGEAVFKPTESCTSSSTSPWYTTEDHNVYYGNKSLITYWPNYFSNVGTTINAHDAASDASMNVPAGTYAPGGGLDVRYVRIYSPTGITPLADIRLNGNVPAQIIGSFSGNIEAVKDNDLNSLIVLLANAPASGNSHGSGYGAVFDFGYVYASANNIRFSLGNITAPRNIVIEVSADNVNWIVVFDQDVYGYDNQYTYYSAPTIVKLPKPASNCRAGTYQPENLTVREFGASTGCVAVDAGYWNNGCGTSATGAVCSTDYSGGLIAPGYYGDVGATTSVGSGKVNAGYYSTGGGTSATPTANGNGCVGSGKTCGLIAAGYYGGAGATTSSGYGTVNGGYYSTGGGTSATPAANGNGCVGSGNTCGKVNGGYYSTGGGTSATPTANGNGCVGDGKKCGLVDENCFSSDRGASSCPTSCSSATNGYFRYSEAGSTSINDCYVRGSELMGKYLSSYNEFLPCPVGSYNDALNEDGSQQRVYYGKPTQCHICPGGKVSAQPGATSKDQCSSGSLCGNDISPLTIGYDWLTPTWNDVLAGQNLCVAASCPKGYAYNTDTKTCYSCPAGHYQDVNGYKGAVCTVSAPGYYVKSTDQTKQTPCPAGEFTSTQQNSSCSKLPAGYWNNGCGTSDTGAVCSADYSGGLIAAGYYGGSGATTNTGSGKVNAGYYSTGGGTSATPTANGNGCVGSGKTCGTIAAGYYGGSGATTNTGSGKVNAGYYSTGGGTSATPTAASNGCISGKSCGTIAAGYYGGAGATSNTGSGTVFAGHFSTGGATNNRPTANDCVGKKSDGTANTCGLVAAGYWTSHGSKTATPTNSETDCVNKLCGILDAGYYSTGGATRSAPTEIGNHCFGTACGRVDAGYYSTGGGTSASGSCISGQECGLIKLGLYSTCGATSAGDTGGNLADKDYLDCVSGCECGRVDAGYYSTGGGTSKTPNGNSDGCIGDGNTCGTVDPGYYSRGGAGNAQPTGYFCWGYNTYSDGITGCGHVAAGYYSNGGGTMPNGTCVSGKSCGPVAAGYYATGGATSNTGNGQVAGGYFATGGATKAEPSSSDCVGSGNTCGLISGGYWSVSGAKTATPIAKTDCIGMGDDNEYCGVISGGYYSTAGATYKYPATQGVDCVGDSTCGKVKPGYYNNGCGINDAGSVCDTTKYEGGVVPAGYYTTGGSSMSPVAAGYYTTGGGTSSTGTCLSGYKCGTVDGGYYSTGGGTSANGTCIGGKSCGLIDAGYYSTGGAKKANPYLSNSCVGKKSDGTANTCGLVNGGYYSTGGATNPTPTANGNGCVGSGKTCGKVAVAYYSNGGGTSANGTCIEGQVCGTCNSNYRGGTLTGKTTESQCQASCAAGTRVVEPNAACTSPAGGWFTAQHLVNYGHISPVNYCMDGFASSSTSASGHDAKSDCVQTINGKDISASTIAARYVKLTANGSTANQFNHVVEIQAFASNDGSGTNLLAGKGGISGGKLTNATDGSWDINTYADGAMIWDLGSVQNLGSLKFAMYTDGRTYHDVTISVSTDKTNYTTVLGPIELKTQKSSIATGELVVLSAAPTNCALGTYLGQTTVALGNTKACSSADAGYFVGSTGASAQTKCKMGSYTSTTGQSACTACAEGKTNDADGSTSCAATCSNSAGVASSGWETTKWNTDNTVTNLCTIKSNGCSANNYKNSNACSTCSSATNSLYTLSAAGATSKNDCYLEPTATKYVASAGAGQVSCAKGGYCPGSTTANPIKIYFGGTHSSTHPTTGGRTQCPAGSYCTAGVSAATTCTTLGGGLYKNSDAGSDEQTDCHFTTTGGYYIDASTDTAEKECEANYYCEATKLNYPNTGSRASCPDPTVSTNVETISDVAWLSTACPDATTSNSSVQYAKWQTWGNTKLKSKSACPVLMYVDTPCAIFQIQSAKFNTTTGKYDADSSSTRIASVVKAGYYFTEPYTSTYCTTSPTALMYYKTAAKCPENSYCPGATVPKCNSGEHVYGEPFGKYACSSLGAFYTTSAAGAKTDTACYGTTTKTKYIAKANDATESVCAENGYCQGGVSVNYGSTGGRTACSGSYTLAASGSDDANDCYLKTTAGSYVKSAGAGQTTCPAGSWCVGNVVIYKGGSVSGRNTSGGSQQCPAGYQDGTTGYSLESQCTMNVTGGHYVASAKESTASGTCQPGYAKAAHPVTYGETSSCDPCKNATYAENAGQASCTACPTAKNTAAQGVVKSYSYWISGDIHTKRNNCQAYFETETLDNGTVSFYCFVDKNADTYGVDGTTTECYVRKSELTCNDGYYNAKFNANSDIGQYNAGKTVDAARASACVPVEEGYWSGSDVWTRTACASGLTTCGSGLCANEAGDCGRKLHAGDKVIHLRSEKRTTPTMVVNIGGTKFYGNLGAVIANSLRVKNGTNNYSVVNDNQ